MDANSNVRRFFVQARWYSLCLRMRSSHLGVAQEFENCFNGQEATIYGLKLQVSKDSIVEELNLPLEGGRWFKGQLITRGDLNSFLKYGHRDPNWAKGIPNSYLKNNGHKLLNSSKFISLVRGGIL